MQNGININNTFKWNNSGGIASMVKGPNGDYFLITEDSSVIGGTLTSNVYYSKISWP